MSTTTKPYRSTSFLCGNQRQLELVDHATLGLGDHTKEFLSHLIWSILWRIGETRIADSRWVSQDGVPCIPISSSFIREHSRGARWETLEERGVVEVTEHDRHRGLSREFSLSAEWLTRYLQAGPAAEELRAPHRLRIPSGRPCRNRVRSRLSPRAGSSLAKQAGHSIERSFFNPAAIEAHLDELWSAVEATTTHRERRSARQRWFTDRVCYNSILGQSAAPARYWEVNSDSEIWAYAPAYQQQRFGRISERGGGLQSCSRRMKAAARQGIMDCRNYDLKDSQARLLVVLMKDAGLDPGWLRDYLSHPKGKAHFAARAGLSVGAWKRALYSVLMGSRVPTPGQLPYSDGSLVAILREDVGEDALAEAHKRFYDITSPLRAQLSPWHTYLVDVWAVENGHYMEPQRKTYVQNAAGVKRALEHLAPSMKRHALKTMLASFLLQGLEASVVHRLALFSAEYGYVTLSHEHDGLVTLGEIPEQAVTRAAVESGIPTNAIVLVEKPFV